jgi:hypothetical protein
MRWHAARCRRTFWGHCHPQWRWPVSFWEPRGPMSYQSCDLAALVIVAAVAIVQLARHLPATLERHTGPAELTLGVRFSLGELPSTG